MLVLYSLLFYLYVSSTHSLKPSNVPKHRHSPVATPNKTISYESTGMTTKTKKNRHKPSINDKMSIKGNKTNDLNSSSVNIDNSKQSQLESDETMKHRVPSNNTLDDVLFDVPDNKTNTFMNTHGFDGNLNANDTSVKTPSIESPSHSYNITAITWNLAEKTPSLNDSRFLREFSLDSDIICIGVQECEDVKPRRHEGRRSKAWRNIQQQLLGKSFRCVTQHKMGGIQLSIFAKLSVADLIEGYQILDCACGIGNVLTNKGGICTILRIKDKSIAFVNAHLAAHQNKVDARNMDYHRIMKTIIAKAQTKWLTPPYAEYKRNVKRLAADQRSVLTTSLLSSSQPFIDQVSR